MTDSQSSLARCVKEEITDFIIFFVALIAMEISVRTDEKQFALITSDVLPSHNPVQSLQQFTQNCE